MMSEHEPIAALFVIVVLLASLMVVAALTDNIHGSQQVQAEYAGFDALAQQLFGGMKVAPGK
jgi:NADH:ubiquinone oxidoreductase subunit 6 (subunit J)